MDIEEIFGQKHKHSKKNYSQHKTYGHNYHDDDDDHYSQSHHHQSKVDFKSIYFDKIQNNPKLKTLIIIAVIGIILILTVTVVLLLPLILKLLQYISENGLQGLLNTILKGTK